MVAVKDRENRTEMMVVGKKGLTLARQPLVLALGLTPTRQVYCSSKQNVRWSRTRVNPMPFSAWGCTMCHLPLSGSTNGR